MLDYADNSMYPLHSLFRRDLYDAENAFLIGAIYSLLASRSL